MENASKALLIAAAILIAIILISLGLIVINQGRTAVDQAGDGISEVSIQAFNAKFDSYFGTAVTGSRVRSLIDAINSNNVANSNDTSKQISVKIGDEKATTTPSRTMISTAKTYTVEAAETNGYVNGYIKNITITAN